MKRVVLVFVVCCLLFCCLPLIQQGCYPFVHSFVVKASYKIHKSIYHFINDCGFPAVTVEKPEFCNLLTCVINNSSFDKSEDFTLMQQGPDVYAYHIIQPICTMHCTTWKQCMHSLQCTLWSKY